MAGQRNGYLLLPFFWVSFAAQSIKHFPQRFSDLLFDYGRHSAHKVSSLTKGFDGEAIGGENFTSHLEQLFLARCNLNGHRLKQPLNLYLPPCLLGANLFKQDALVGGMLIDKV
ncbi:hypothetical protein ES703_106774 [subsurface metagenome]